MSSKSNKVVRIVKGTLGILIIIGFFVPKLLEIYRDEGGLSAVFLNVGIFGALLALLLLAMWLIVSSVFDH